jgi:ferritin-like protein
MFNHNPDERIKRLEEEVMYLHRDIANLINIIENVKPEIHTHYTLITENICNACMDDPNNTNDLDELS